MFYSLGWISFKIHANKFQARQTCWTQYALRLGLSTGRSRLGLCLTRNRPEGIGFWKISPTADCQSKRVGPGQTSTGGGRVGWHLGSEKTGRKQRENSRKRRGNSRSSESLIGIYEISLDLAVISSDLMRFHQIWSKSHLIYVKYRMNLGFLAKIWVFFVGFWNFSHRNLGFSLVGSGFSGFGG